MIDRLLRRGGIDAAQWRALTKAYLLMDFRKGGGPQQMDEHGRTRRQWLTGNPYAPLVIASFFNSIAAGFIVIAVRDVFTAAVGVVSLAALNTSLVVLMDFTGFVISASDHLIIGARPVSSRTYFAARISAVLVYVSTGAAIMSIFPAIAFSFHAAAGIGGALGTVLATILCCTAAAAAAIAAYTFTIGHIHPRRIARAMTLVQLGATAISLGLFYFAIEAVGETVASEVSIRGMRWIWALPPAWFGAIVPAASGTGTPGDWAAVSGGLLFTVLALVLAAGRMSLDVAERLAEAASSAETARRRIVERIPGFRGSEPYAVATLIRAQFRYDTRFRLTVLSMIPLTIFYLLLGLEEGALLDPFTTTQRGSSPIFFAITFLPMTLHSSIRYSDHWRAAWIFFASPADPARLVIAAKNFVAFFFLGAYAIVLSFIWGAFYERYWHAAFHAGIVGAFAHLLLQGAVIVTPMLPFVVEPRRVDQTSRVFLLIFVGSIAGGVLPGLLPLLYRQNFSLIALVIMLVTATLILEVIVRYRVREAVSHLEFA